jgi:hypothetical protein
VARMTRTKTGIAAMAGLSLAMGVTAGAGSAAAAAGAGATPDETCTSTSTFWMEKAPGKKANVSLCVQTNGKTMHVTASADCFSGWGLSQYDHCYANGAWKLQRGEETVANGAIGSSAAGTTGTEAVYPGPGTYTLVGDVTARASQQVGGGGTTSFEASGRMERSVTLTTPLPGPRLQGYGTPSALTVTNKGERTANAVTIRLSSLVLDPKKVTTDKRCAPAGAGRLACTLGNLAPGASDSVPLNTQETSKLCGLNDLDVLSLFFWSYQAENYPEQRGPVFLTTGCTLP